MIKKLTFSNGSSISFSDLDKSQEAYEVHWDFGIGESRTVIIMNRDQLQSLIRLANDNPSEEEANSAARAVCKFLANYSFPNEVSGEFNYLLWCQRHRKLKTMCGCK